MNKNTAAKGKFKSKGDSILKTRKAGPESMKEFLGDSKGIEAEDFIPMAK